MDPTPADDRLRPAGETPGPMPVADRIVDGLRTFAADNAEVVQHLAHWLGISVGDAAAFGEVLYAQDRGKPLTPTLLGRRTGLSSGAIGALLNRLENAGLLVRTREHRDRRVVTLRATPDVKEQSAQFFMPLAERVDTMMREHPEELLLTFVKLLDQLHDVVADVLANLEVPPRALQGPPGPSGVEVGVRLDAGGAEPLSP